MKTLSNYITEKLKISKSKKLTSNKKMIKVNNNEELFSIITERKGSIIDLTDLDVYDVTSFNKLFYALDVEEIDITGWDTSNGVNFNYMFYGCKSLKKIHGIEDIDVSNSKSFIRMFNYCQKLTGIDLSGWDVSNASRFDFMFCACNAMTSFDFIEKWNMHNATDISYMFQYCTRLEEIDLSQWDTKMLTSSYEMFERCNSLKKANLSGWDVKKIINLTGFFGNCLSLEEVNLTGWQTDKLLTTSSMFKECGSLKTIHGIENFNVSNVKYAKEMFCGCKELTADLTNWSFNDLREKQKMFMKTNKTKLKRPQAL